MYSFRSQSSHLQHEKKSNQKPDKRDKQRARHRASLGSIISDIENFFEKWSIDWEAAGYLATSGDFELDDI